MSALYYDPSNPGRQDILTLTMNKLFPVLDLDEEKTIVAARNSIFMDSQALRKMMELLISKSGEGESL